uniref:helix-turn-helix domain-containing protein n=1 Tax=Candidatus Scatousia sp. TaxID=3085663 RepID=UPI004027EC23
MDIRKIFGANVRKYRKRKGFSQEKLAEFVDLGDKSISPIETGRSFIAIDKLEKLCEVLEVEPFQLFLTNETSGEIADDLRRERVLTRLKTCNREELELLCDVLTKFIER